MLYCGLNPKFLSHYPNNTDLPFSVTVLVSAPVAATPAHFNPIPNRLRRFGVSLSLLSLPSNGQSQCQCQSLFGERAKHCNLLRPNGSIRSLQHQRNAVKTVILHYHLERSNAYNTFTYTFMTVYMTAKPFL